MILEERGRVSFDLVDKKGKSPDRFISVRGFFLKGEQGTLKLETTFLN